MNWSQPPQAPSGEDAVADPGETSAPARPVRTFWPRATVCAQCGGEIDLDGYCLTCGEKALDPRLHYELTPSDWAAGVCDRGRRHPDNEDALAIHASSFEQGRAVLVVCDGVSMAADSQEASLSAAHAAASVVVGADFDWDLGLEAAKGATGELLGQTTAAANRAVLDSSDPQVPNPASCTIAVGLLSGRQMLSATVGDSRVYWIPDAGSGLQLSTDDSMAQQQMEVGVDRQAAENGEYGHVITRWLGRDAPDIRPRVAVATAECDGWFLVCSDGLWNYASDPGEMAVVVEAIARELGEPTPLELARGLVAWANAQGGLDNITVALARVHLGRDSAPGGDAVPGTTEAPELDSTTVRIRR